MNSVDSDKSKGRCEGATGPFSRKDGQFLRIAELGGGEAGHFLEKAGKIGVIAESESGCYLRRCIVCLTQQGLGLVAQFFVDPLFGGPAGLRLDSLAEVIGMQVETISIVSYRPGSRDFFAQ